MNKLYFGDNLDILRDKIAPESVDLVYLDPPFNSKAQYNVLFRSPAGSVPDASLEAFQDSWRWGESAEAAYADVITNGGSPAKILGSLRSSMGENDMMAYLAMMTVRLIELHRVLKRTGSLYLHCDPTASHYLKIILDAVFEPTNFRSEIIWKRSHGHNSAKRYGPAHDTILFYGNSNAITWNKIFHDYDVDYVKKHYRHKEADGRLYKHENPTGAGIRRGATGEPWHGINPTAKGRHWVKPPDELEKLNAAGLIYWPDKQGAWPYIKIYLDKMKGVPVQDVWTDIDVLNMMAKERLDIRRKSLLALWRELFAPRQTMVT